MEIYFLLGSSPPPLNLFFYTFSLLIRAPSNIFPLWHLQTYLAFVDPLLSFPASLPSTQLVPLHFSSFSCHRTFQAFEHSLLPFLIPSLGVSFLVSGPITHIPIHITIHEWQWGTGIHMWERIRKTFFQPGLKCFLSFLYYFSYKSKRGDDQAPFAPPNAVAARKDTG